MIDAKPLLINCQNSRQFGLAMGSSDTSGDGGGCFFGKFHRSDLLRVGYPGCVRVSIEV